MKINQLKLGVYLSYTSIFISNITNLVLTPFIVRNLGQSEYGLYVLIGAFVGYIAVMDFGLGNATTRFVAKYRAENDSKSQENFLASTFIIYLFISIIVLGLGVILYLNLDNIFGDSLTIDEINIAKVMFIILIINLALTLPMKSFTGIVNAYEHFVFPKSLIITRLLIRAIVIIILLSLGYKAIAIVLVDAILNVVMMLITMAYVFFKLKVKILLHSLNLQLFKEITSYSSLIFVSVIVDQIYWRIGHLVLGIYAGTSEVAIFAIGMLFGQYFITFSTAISGVFLPRITKMVVKNASSEKLTDLLIKTGRIQFLVLGFAIGGFILFGGKFILLWLGPGYELSWSIALMVVLPLSIVLTQTIGISILQAKNMHGFRAITYLFIAVINLFISIYLAKRFGSIGVTVGTTLSLIFGNLIIMNIYYHFKVKLNILRFFKELFNKLLFSILLSIVIGMPLLLLTSNTWGILIIQSLIYTVIYFGIIWIFGMNDYEKNLFRNEGIKLRKIVYRR
ncbi:oligosaccharide flippase family protein [Sutcliffiella halmapala]|uniref:oligosaccharide flippase family protein n=1 Tax=Sutcliffiella halmapala TaxID=79882 RepID=UPI0009958D0A|nr:oligosaccharide flippase family protein [Sutcliffiella halmapala]